MPYPCFLLFFITNTCKQVCEKKRANRLNIQTKTLPLRHDRQQ